MPYIRPVCRFTFARLSTHDTHLCYFRYGQEAGKLTENTMYSAGNVAMTAYSASNLGVKAIVKKAAKDTGRAVLEDYHKDIANKSPDNDGYPPDKGNQRGQPM